MEESDHKVTGETPVRASWQARATRGTTTRKDPVGSPKTTAQEPRNLSGPKADEEQPERVDPQP